MRDGGGIETWQARKIGIALLRIDTAKDKVRLVGIEGHGAEFRKRGERHLRHFRRIRRYRAENVCIMIGRIGVRVVNDDGSGIAGGQ